MTKKQLIKAIEKHRDAIAKERDALRELISDALALGDSSEEAVAALDTAIDSLSEYA